MARKRNYDILANAAALVGAMPSAQSASLVETDAAFAASSAKLERHHSCCHGCYNCCPVWVYTEDGVVVKMEGDYDGTLSKGSISTKAEPAAFSLQSAPRAAPHATCRHARHQRVDGHQLG